MLYLFTALTLLRSPTCCPAIKCINLKGFCHNKVSYAATVQTRTQWKAVAEMREILHARGNPLLFHFFHTMGGSACGEGNRCASCHYCSTDVCRADQLVSQCLSCRPPMMVAALCLGSTPVTHRRMAYSASNQRLLSSVRVVWHVCHYLHCCAG